MATWNKIDWTLAMDDRIRDVYQTGRRGGNKALARAFDLSPRAISARAGRLGLPSLVSTNARGPLAWREGEKAIVAAHSYEPLAQIRARLYKAGYYRSIGSIRGLIGRMREIGALPSRDDALDDKDLMRTPTIAAHLGVPTNRVSKWISSGELIAKKLQNTDPPVYCVRMVDLRKFLIHYQSRWDHRRADKLFLIDVLSYSSPRSDRNKTS